MQGKVYIIVYRVKNLLMRGIVHTCARKNNENRMVASMDDLAFSSVLQHENFVDLALRQMGRVREEMMWLPGGKVV